MIDNRRVNLYFLLTSGLAPQLSSIFSTSCRDPLSNTSQKSLFKLKLPRNGGEEGKSLIFWSGFRIGKLLNACGLDGLDPRSPIGTCYENQIIWFYKFSSYLLFH